MKPRFLPGLCTTGIVFDHTDNTTGKYLPDADVLAHVQRYSAAVGREPSIISIYNEWQAGFTFPHVMCKAVRNNGKTPCLILWPDDVPEHRLDSLAWGRSDTILRTLAYALRDFSTPVILGIDEPSGFLWGEPSQGAPEALPGLFVQFWRRMHGIIAPIAPNVSFFLRGATGWGADNASNPDRWKLFKHWWPGAEYVDIVGLNANSYGVMADGTPLWPKETSPGIVWTADDAVNEVKSVLATLPGAGTLPLSIGFWCAQDLLDDSDVGRQAERVRLARMLGLMEATGVCWLDLWAADEHVRGVDVTRFSTVTTILKARFTRPKFTAHVGIS